MEKGLLGKAYRPTFIFLLVVGGTVCGLIIWATW